MGVSSQATRAMPSPADNDAKVCECEVDATLTPDFRRECGGMMYQTQLIQNALESRQYAPVLSHRGVASAHRAFHGARPSQSDPPSQHQPPTKPISQRWTEQLF